MWMGGRGQEKSVEGVYKPINKVSKQLRNSPRIKGVTTSEKEGASFLWSRGLGTNLEGTRKKRNHP